jgi:hypothetical protein
VSVVWVDRRSPSGPPARREKAGVSATRPALRRLVRAKAPSRRKTSGGGTGAALPVPPPVSRYRLALEGLARMHRRNW